MVKTSKENYQINLAKNVVVISGNYKGTVGTISGYKNGKYEVFFWDSRYWKKRSFNKKDLREVVEVRKIKHVKLK